tara:strand:- start:4443 stop:5075 length:633 start_codon:yes stop_codon:yes gene_type:complete
MNYSVLKKIFPNENCKCFDNLKYDSEGLWSISHPNSADEISKKIKLFEKTGLIIETVFDSTAGLGGNTLSFAKFFKNVIAVEYDKNRFEMLKNNVNNYIYQNIDLINDDFLNILKNSDVKIDAIFVDPPWGGPNYKYDSNLKLNISNLEMKDILKIIYEYNFNNNKIKIAVFKLPYNYNYKDLINECSDFIKIHNIIKENNIIYLINTFN